jgi:enoyl-CoA hydratase/carnithine racemase
MTVPVELQVDKPVARIRLNRPRVLNAIDDSMLDALIESMERAGTDDRVRVIVLSGNGRAFCAGGDIRAMEAMDPPSFAATIERYRQLALVMRGLSRPLVAMLHGYVLAGGFELALLCDLRVAAASTRLGLPDAALGLSPTSGMTWLLPRLVGLGRAFELLWSRETIDGAEAERLGIVTAAVADDRLEEQVAALAARLAAWPAAGMAHTRALLRAGLESTFEEALEAEVRAEIDCFADPEVRARFRRFLARR